MQKFYIGIIEDRQDPEMLGRVRVRVVGLHSANKIELPTEELQWALVMNPINSASVNGIGDSPTGLVEGSTVVITFLDEFRQQPLVLGSIASKQDELPDFAKGFSDPKKKYPLEDFLGESDVNRLSRGITENTILDKKLENKAVGVPTSINGVPWSEPVSYEAEYPLCHTRATESGHIIELDDTEGNERMSWNHRTGTYSEINAQGSQINHIVGDNYHITENNGYVYVKGMCNITVDGDTNIMTRGNANIEIANNANMRVGKNLNFGVSGDVNWVVDGNYNLKVNGQFNSQTGAYGLATEDYDVYANGKMNIHATGDIDIGDGAKQTTLGLKTIKIKPPIMANRAPLSVPGLSQGGITAGSGVLSLSDNAMAELSAMPMDTFRGVAEAVDSQEEGEPVDRNRALAEKIANMEFEVLDPEVKIISIDEEGRVSAETVKELSKLPKGSLTNYTPETIGRLAELPQETRKRMNNLDNTVLCDLLGLPADILRGLGSLPADILNGLQSLSTGAIAGLDGLQTGNFFTDFVGDILDLSVNIVNGLESFATDNLRGLLGLPQDLIRGLEGLSPETLANIGNLPADILNGIAGLPQDVLECVSGTAEQQG